MSVVLENDGPGSTLDADTLDGSQASDFSLAGHGHDDLLKADGSQVGATSQAQQFAYPVEAPWFDPPLLHPVESNHFNTNEAGIPTGWTQILAPSFSGTNLVRGFWALTGSPTVSAWKFRRRMGVIAEDKYLSLQWGPILWRDGDYNADVTYMLGMYADDGADGIDEAKFNRIEFYWNSAAKTWQVRSVISNGATTLTGAYQALSRPLAMPLYLRCANSLASNTKRGYVGTTPYPNTQSLLQSGTASITWGQPWMQISMTRGTGVNDSFYVGGYDRFEEI